MVRTQKVFGKKIINKNDRPVLVAVGGGKGGVGKTIISSSLSVGLAMLGKRVVVIDADFGCANLHKALGIERAEKNTYQFFKREVQTLDEILIDHPQFEHLKIICGATGTLGSANLHHQQSVKFIRHIQKLDADYVIIDLGTGSHFVTLDLFLASDMGLVVVNPVNLSILDSYNFLKQAFFRKLSNVYKKNDVMYSAINKAVRNIAHQKSPTIEDLHKQIVKLDEDAGKYMRVIIESFHSKLLINRLVSSKNIANCLAVQMAAKELLSIDVEYIGAIREDVTVSESLNEMNPFISYDPKCNASVDLTNLINKKILHASILKSMKTKKIIKNKKMLSWKDEEALTYCSIKCMYWEECDFKNPGYPCELKELL